LAEEFIQFSVKLSGVLCQREPTLVLCENLLPEGIHYFPNVSRKSSLNCFREPRKFFDDLSQCFAFIHEVFSKSGCFTQCPVEGHARNLK
jgi:hypothetical protein